LVAEVYDFAREGASLSAILTSSAPFSGWDCAHQHHIESDKTPALRIFCDLFDPTIWAEMTLPRAKALGIDWLAGMTRVADIMVAGHRPPPDSEFVHQLSGVAEVNFDSGAIKVTSPVWITRSGCWSVIHVASSAQLSEKCGLSWLRCVSEI
jgi:hypothetical protein